MEKKHMVGFIGLGVMGKPMSKNLLKAGYPLVVYDLIGSKMSELVSIGAEGAGSPKDVSKKCEIIITMVPDSPEVEIAVLGENGVIEGVKEGAIVIDMSSINPFTTRKAGDALAKKGVEMLDAPVSGGEEGAIKGELAIMVGGKEEIFKKSLPLFKSMGKSITYVGELGGGEMMKLVNQLIVAVNIAALSEAFMLGAKAGLSAQTMFQAIRGGLAGSKVMETKVPRFVERNFAPGFKIDLHIKDLKNALTAAQELKVPVPFASLVGQVMLALSNKGKGANDHGGMVEFWEDMAGGKVK